MHFSSLFLSTALAALVSAQPHERAVKPTLYLAGDSTTAPLGGRGGTEGWGQYLHYSMSIPVKNYAFAGRSARSFTREGRFKNITDSVKAGDWVVIEFGHNDGASSPDNGRSDCPGSGTEVCHYVYNGVSETVYTMPQYLEWAAGNITAKGAHVVISSQTPNNPDETGVFVNSPPRFVALAKHAAEVAGVDYVDHFAYSLAAYKPLSVATVNSYFPNDHTHTAPKGAELVSKAFVRGLVCNNSNLKAYVLNSTASIQGSCL